MEKYYAMKEHEKEVAEDVEKPADELAADRIIKDIQAGHAVLEGDEVKWPAGLKIPKEEIGDAVINLPAVRCVQDDQKKASDERSKITMDPDKNLEEQLELAAEIQKLLDASEEIGLVGNDDAFLEVSFELSHRTSRLIELVEAMDGWLSKGGFLPKRWERR